MRGRMPSTSRGVNALFTSPRSRVWSGGSRNSNWCGIARKTWRAAARYSSGSHSSPGGGPIRVADMRDRKSTRLNSSHTVISYAVFCLKKKISQRTESKRPGRRRPRRKEQVQTVDDPDTVNGSRRHLSRRRQELGTRNGELVREKVIYR